MTTIDPANAARRIIATYGLDRYARRWRNQPRPRGVRQRNIGDCYANAYDLATNRGLAYVEGFAPHFQHAWVIDGQGRVIDPTWRDTDTIYIGVPFLATFVATVLLREHRHGDMLRHASNAIRNGQPIAEIINLDALARFDATDGAQP